TGDLRRRGPLLRPDEAGGDRGRDVRRGRGPRRARRARACAGPRLYLGRVRSPARRGLRGIGGELDAAEPESARNHTVAPARNKLAELVGAAPGKRVERAE